MKGHSTSSGSRSRLCKLLKIKYPIFQAPMAGGITPPALVAAVSNAGGLGNIGAAMMTPKQIVESIREIKSRTDQPFGVNLFIPQPFTLDLNKLVKIKPKLEDILKKAQFSGGNDASFALDIHKGAQEYQIPFDEQADAILSENVPIFSWTFGLPSKERLEQFKKAKITTVGTATNADEAKACLEAGVDAIVAQGSEAGGHRGAFLQSPSDPSTMIGTMALVPLIVDAINGQLPVIAAGGVMDGRSIVAAHALGAEAVQMGTAFLTTKESGASTSYKQCLLSSEGRQRPTVITKAFSGRPARGVHNAFIADMAREEREDSLPDFPILNALTRSIRKLAAQKGDFERQSLWAGQAFHLTRSGLSARELIEILVEEVRQQHQRQQKEKGLKG